MLLQTDSSVSLVLLLHVTVNFFNPLTRTQTDKRYSAFVVTPFFFFFLRKCPPHGYSSLELQIQVALFFGFWESAHMMTMMALMMTMKICQSLKKNESSQQMWRKMPTWVGYRILGLQSPSCYMELAIFCSEVPGTWPNSVCCKWSVVAIGGEIEILHYWL